jgi:hypothetical protein
MGRTLLGYHLSIKLFLFGEYPLNKPWCIHSVLALFKKGKHQQPFEPNTSLHIWEYLLRLCIYIYILFWQTNWNDGICHMSYSKWLWLSYGFDYLSGHQVVVDPMFTHTSAQKVIQNLLHSPTREPGSWKAACTFVHVSINNPHSGCSAKIWVEEAFCCTR